MTPEQLFAMIDEQMTTVQAMRVVEPFIGTTITVDGLVRDVTERSLWLDGPGAAPSAIMQFDADRAERFHRLSKGERVSVCGEIEGFSRRTVRLTRCEVIQECALPPHS